MSSQESLVWLRDVRTRALLWTKEWCLQISVRAGGLRKPKQGLGGDRAAANVAVGCHYGCSMLFVSLCARSDPDCKGYYNSGRVRYLPNKNILRWLSTR